MSKGLRIAIGVGLFFVGGGSGALIARSIGFNLITGAVLERKPRKFKTAAVGSSVMVRSATEPQVKIYGRTKRSGPVVFMESTGPSRRFLWFVIAVAEHEIDAVESLWINGKEIDVATEIDGSGFVTKSDFVDSDGNNLVRAGFHLGAASQAADPELLSGIGAWWTANHRGDGVAYFWVRLELDTSEGGSNPNSASANVWAQGVPSDIALTVRGAKVYDPRLDSTNGGSGTHRLADPSTWSWSTNPVLCIADYLTDARLGAGFPSTSIDWTVVAAQASICDEQIEIPTPVGFPQEYADRYTLNGAVETSDTVRSNLEAMLSACAGSIAYTAGTFKIYAGAYATPSHDIDETWLREGGVSVEGALPRTEVYNAVRGRYTSRAEGFELVEFEPRTSDVYESADGGLGRVWRDVDLAYTEDEYHAQLLGLIELKRSRSQVVAVLKCNRRAVTVGLWETVRLSLDEFGWSNKTFRVVGWTWSPDGGVDLTLREEEATDWTYTLEELDEVSFGTPPPDGYGEPAAPSNLVATGVLGGVRLDFDLPPMQGVRHIEIYAAATNSRPTTTAGRVGVTSSNYFLHRIPAGETRFYWILARGANGLVSSFFPVSATGGVSATALSENPTVAGTLSNEAHTVAAANDGTGYDLTGAGGTFQVWEGTSDVTGAGPVYSVVGSATRNGLSIAIDPATGVYSLSGADWSTNLETFTLRASYNGVNVDRVYSISKSLAGAPGTGDPARLVRIEAEALAFLYDGTGALVSADSIDFTARRENSSAAVSWRSQRWNGSAWVDTATNRLSPTTGLGSTLTAAAFVAEGETALRVVATMTDGGTDYVDAVTIVRVQDGAGGEDGLTALPASFAPGNVGGTSDFLLRLNYVNTTPNPGEVVVVGSRLYGPDGSENTFTGGRVDVATPYGEGVAGRFFLMFVGLKNGNSRFSTISVPDAIVPVRWNGTSWEAFQNDGTAEAFVPLSTDILFAVIEADSTSSGLTRGVLLTSGVPGSSAISGVLSNEAHTVAAAADGTGYSLTGAGGTFQIWLGATNVTGAGPVYSVVGSATRNGLSIAIDPATGVYSLSGADWSTDLETFTLRAVYEGVTIDRVYTISKSRAGAGGSPGAPAKLLRIEPEAQAFKYNTAGTLIAPSSIDFTARRENSSAAVSWRSQRWNGSAWVDTATNRLSPTQGLSSTLTEAAFEAEGQNALRVVATMTDGATYTDAVTVVRVQDGAVGDPGPPGLSVVVVKAYRRATSPPATPSGGSYNFTTKVLTPPSGWSATPPTGTGTLYESTATASVQGTTGTATPTGWSSPVAASGEIEENSASGTGASLTLNDHNSTGRPIAVSISASLDGTTTTGSGAAWSLRLLRRIGSGSWLQVGKWDGTETGILSCQGPFFWSRETEFNPDRFSIDSVGINLVDTPGTGLIDYYVDFNVQPGGAAGLTYSFAISTRESG